MGKRKRKNANKPAPFVWDNPQNLFIQPAIPKPPSSGKLYDLMQRNRFLEQESKERQLLDLRNQHEIDKLKIMKAS